ncbi:ATP-dependent RNA helicase DHX8 [Taphrina deformans PYCC 5710]|uniref:RNA helicase n=1 Tax=Taphrina deformans (strain PYCC 5710 / ATCC 11124 / CBS 356.35 / IMI 108563 / JCM 9778 / NBRC 8474) TaxID=1097556 RepID=R4XF81_TAPDE|nr:ATP-dependent RNA helicase DHX8 [Taphrina deformans PYCC 5710]|eukprot:CCG82017.1 ATP-dependent RNA helicase DHX8 [Taphrina deformans PYCC 5710]
MVKQHFKFDDAPQKDIEQPLEEKAGNVSAPNGSSQAAVNLVQGLTLVHGSYATQEGVHASAKAGPKRKRAVDFFNDDAIEKPSLDGHAVTKGFSYIAQSPAKRQKILESRTNLPIAKHADLLRQKIRENNVIILLGETGSGKSTQLPQFLLQDFSEGCIGVTQPRRVAAINLAKRVSEEMDVQLGKEVGYSIRFDDTSSRQTKIKYLTDGMLLIELLRDPWLSKYSTIILDEAHERTLLTDLLLGFMKLLLKRRIGMKVVVMSATLDAERFSKFFDGAEIVKIEGRTYPVELYYSKISQPDFLDAVLRTVFQLHLGQASGDILVFLTGSDEIENLAKQIRDYSEQLKKDVPHILVLPLYASLPQDQQARVFHATPRNTRKIILATNIAETSITVPGVRYVIDAGLQKIKAFNAKIGFESLEISPVSQSSADQRTGRAGREAPGKCWRMYQEATYKSLDKSAEAEIRRVELSQAILALKARDVDDVIGFPYIEPPSRESIVRALEHLYSLGALDDGGSITTIGKQMSTIPLPPALARVLLASQKEGCVLEIVDIVSCLSVDGVFLDRPDQREEIAESRKKFESVEGDHITLLNVLRAYQEVTEGVSKWCDDSFLDKRALRTVTDIKKQLLQHAVRANMDTTASASAAPPEHILRAFLTGFVSHTAFLSPDGSYRTTTGNSAVSIHPSSVLYGQKVEAIVYHESIFTTRLWVRGVSRIESQWVRDVAPNWAGRRSA